jgi:hypothetical protein
MNPPGSFAYPKLCEPHQSYSELLRIYGRPIKPLCNWAFTLWCVAFPHHWTQVLTKERRAIDFMPGEKLTFSVPYYNLFIIPWFLLQGQKGLFACDFCFISSKGTLVFPSSSRGIATYGSSISFPINTPCCPKRFFLKLSPLAQMWVTEVE